MSAKYFIYILVAILVIWSFDSLNINSFLKKSCTPSKNNVFLISTINNILSN